MIKRVIAGTAMPLWPSFYLWGRGRKKIFPPPCKCVRSVTSNAPATVDSEFKAQ